jgi:hypothetical protein
MSPILLNDGIRTRSIQTGAGDFTAWRPYARPGLQERVERPQGGVDTVLFFAAGRDSIARTTRTRMV